ncbi:MAG: ATPase, partial [Nitrospirales bacterium]|nr:ATPase [Nitrospirales bacterium]
MNNGGIAQINDQAQQYSGFVSNIISEIEKVIVGQRYLVERLLVALFADGHLLIEGVPGLAKTTSIKVLADIIKAR